MVNIAHWIFLRETKTALDPTPLNWYRQLHLVLSTEDKKITIKHPIPAASHLQPTWTSSILLRQLQHHAALVKGPKGRTTSYVFKQAEPELLQTEREFSHLHAGRKHEETLPKKYAIILHFIAINSRNSGPEKLKINDKALREGHGERGKGKMGYAPNNAPFSPKPKTPPPPKKDNPAKDAICHQFGKCGVLREVKAKPWALEAVRGDGPLFSSSSNVNLSFKLPIG
ncbi:hypothetical protein Tco_1068208 [Tanacetum coccineum]|uniref:Uncharacterized protein n=1 Tax=Tanacetum coccineum TaxID=301880 RepID=A0ABQ5HF43_9ASTR